MPHLVKYGLPGRMGHTGEEFPSRSNGDGVDYRGSTSTPLGNGLFLILGPNGEYLDIRMGQQAPQGRTTTPQEAARMGAQTANEQAQLAQFDRELDFRIQESQRNLAESRRQFDVSTGLERERIAAQMARLEKQIANDMAIAKLDSRTRLDIAGMQAATAKRGQNISREQFGLNLQARRAEFGATTLGRDTARQALFELGESGGTTPLELAAQTFPTQEIPTISAAGGAVVDATGSPTKIQVGEEGPETLLAGGGKVSVIPKTLSAAEPGAIGAARETFQDLLRRAFESGPMARFGGLQDIEPFFGQDIEAPSKMAFSFSQKSPAVQRVILSVLGVRGFDQEEALRRMRAATPEAAFSGLARQR
ncbi:hypothetical protein LCGC14_1572250 [marine sediment metagenome]|uniref:Uncharacterized protein n=1 Tax=marine sediment metagenome TaxID=412755 RepID=A0A0F9J5K7_9ZZZZ